MKLGRLKCKDNNAAYVKRMMPAGSGEPMRWQTHIMHVLSQYILGIQHRKKNLTRIQIRA